MQCTNNLKQLGIAAHNYHDTNTSAIPAGGYKYYTPSGDYSVNAAGGQVANSGPIIHPISGFVALLPFYEQTALYQSIVSNYYSFTKTSTDPGTQILRNNLSPLLCPSDGEGKSRGANDQSRNNYRMCFGDYPVHDNILINDTFDAANLAIGTAATNICNANRGAFALQQWNGLHSMTDGTSNTIAFSERCIANSTTGGMVRRNIVTAGGAAPTITAIDNTVTSPSGALALDTFVSNAKGVGANYSTASVTQTFGDSGKRWTHGSPLFVGFVTILPPNAPSYRGSNDAAVGKANLISASSNHSGGVNAAMGDGAVKFFSDTTDVKGNNGGSNLSDQVYTSGKSSHGIWGALGTRNGGESVSPP
jgi:prepilin-type processing-associated H-X9-DG protein